MVVLSQWPKLSCYPWKLNDSTGHVNLIKPWGEFHISKWFFLCSTAHPILFLLTIFFSVIFYLACLQSGKCRQRREKWFFYFFTKYPRRRDNFLSVKFSLYSVRQSNYESKTNPHCLIRSLKSINASWNISPCLRHKVRQWEQSGNIERFIICFFS